MFVAKVKDQTIFGAILDFLMMPVMLVCQFTLTESLQRTHFWNNQKLSDKEKNRLDVSMGVESHGDPAVNQRWVDKNFPIFHIPILGGWKKFIVVEPEDDEETWFPGWMAEDVTGVSQIKVVGRVKLLLGPGKVTFFGVDRFGEQIFLKRVGSGVLGKKSPYRKVPLR